MPRRDFSKVAFAATGDTNSIPTPTQPDGSVSLQQGFTFDYQRDNGAGGGTPDPLAKNIDREDMNGILNEITASVGEMQQNGYPIWASTAAPYPINALVRHLDSVWQSTVANNNDTPGSTANWKNKSVASAGTLINVQKFTASTTYTPTAGTNSIIVQVQGGGGGGGGANAAGSGASSGGHGGGAGGYAESRIISGFSGQVITVGSPGSGTSAAGGNGGGSSFGATVTASGGLGGGLITGTASFPLQGTGGDGTTGAGGNIYNSRGGDGLGAVLLAATNGVSGAGGSSRFSPGGARRVGSSTAGLAGENGSGGSGAIAQNGAAAIGGAGGRGLVIIWEYA